MVSASVKDSPNSIEMNGTRGSVDAEREWRSNGSMVNGGSLGSAADLGAIGGERKKNTSYVVIEALLCIRISAFVKATHTTSHHSWKFFC